MPNNEYDRRLKRKQQKDIDAGRCPKKPEEKKPGERIEEIKDIKPTCRGKK